jgi:hypothetical protein
VVVTAMSAVDGGAVEDAYAVTGTLHIDGHLSLLASGWGWLLVVAVLVVILATAAAVIVHRSVLRDARPTATDAAVGPPEGFDSTLSAVLLNSSGISMIVPAQVIEQAVGGSIRLRPVPSPVGSPHRQQAELVDRSRARNAGAVLLGLMFGTGPTYMFGDQNSPMRNAQNTLQSWATERLESLGLRRTVPAGLRGTIVLMAGAGGAGSVFFAIMCFFAGVQAVPAAIGLGLGVLGMAATVILLAHAPLSEVGAEAKSRLARLERFIESRGEQSLSAAPGSGEVTRVGGSSPQELLDLYEKLLPYAIIFGRQKQWSRQLAVLYQATGRTGPSWCSSTVPFDADAFAASINALETAPVGAPRAGPTPTVGI